MKKVLFSVALALVAGFSFAQVKNVKEAKSIANEMNPDFAKAEQLIISLTELIRRILRGGDLSEPISTTDDCITH